MANNMANIANESKYTSNAHPAYCAQEAQRAEAVAARAHVERAADGFAVQQDLRVLRVPVGTRLADVERWMIFATLGRCAGNKTRTAALLGVSLKTLYNRLNAYRAHGLAMDYEMQDYDLTGEDVVDGDAAGQDPDVIHSELT